MTIFCMYDPDTGACGSIPNSLGAKNGKSMAIQVNLALVPGALGSIIFDDPPLSWGSNGSPPGATTLPANGGTTQETISFTNNNSGSTKLSYGFLINFVYTSPKGEVVKGAGDPTIINDGTGS
jgi:hypothetical protein